METHEATPELMTESTGEKSTCSSVYYAHILYVRACTCIHVQYLNLYSNIRKSVIVHTYVYIRKPSFRCRLCTITDFLMLV